MALKAISDFTLRHNGAVTHYKEGDTVILPPDFKFDPVYSNLPRVKRPTFTYETVRKVRNTETGSMENEADLKRVLLPVTWPEESGLAEPAPVVEAVDEEGVGVLGEIP